MQEGYELQWTVNEIVKDLEAIRKRLAKLDLNISQKADILDEINLFKGQL